MAKQSKDITRYLRYANVVEAVLAKEEFPLYEIKQACQDEQPAFVTRVVKGLEKDGILKRTDDGPKPMFRWRLNRDEFSVSGWLDRQIYGARLTRTPVAERPRERLLAHGAASLRIAELLAILIRSGRPGESALQAGEKIANRFADCLEKLPDAGRGELKSISPAIEQTAYCQIMAAIELGRRVAAASDALNQKAEAITSSEHAIGFCRRHFARLAEEGSQGGVSHRDAEYQAPRHCQPPDQRGHVGCKFGPPTRGLPPRHPRRGRCHHLGAQSPIRRSHTEPRRPRSDRASGESSLNDRHPRPRSHHRRPRRRHQHSRVPRHLKPRQPIATRRGARDNLVNSQ